MSPFSPPETPKPLEPPSPPPIPFQASSARRCSELGLEYDATLGVCGSSQLGGCLMSATWSEALARCNLYGARLCTLAELPVNKGGGCGLDAKLVWVWEACEH